MLVNIIIHFRLLQKIDFIWVVRMHEIFNLINKLR